MPSRVGVGTAVTYLSTSRLIILASLTQVLSPASIVAISVFKPWGKRKKQPRTLPGPY